MAGKKSKRKADRARSLSEADRSSTAATAGRTPKLTSMVPVRFEPIVLAEVRRRAEMDGRSVSGWIRRAVQAELDRSAADDNRFGSRSRAH